MDWAANSVGKRQAAVNKTANMKVAFFTVRTSDMKVVQFILNLLRKAEESVKLSCMI